MNPCRICGRLTRGRYCKEKCEGELECLSCGVIKDSSEYHDYRSTGGQFRASCKKCYGEEKKKHYKPVAYRTKKCIVCQEKFKYIGYRVICDSDNCKRVMARIYEEYYLKRKRGKWKAKEK